MNRISGTTGISGATDTNLVLKKGKRSGSAATLYCTGRDIEYEDTLAELEDLAKAAGFQITAAVAAIAEHSIARRIAAGRPDGEDKVVLAGFGQTIRERLQAGGTAGTIPGNRPYKQTGGGGMVPLTADTCIRCGQCVRQCPAEAIDREFGLGMAAFPTGSPSGWGFPLGMAAFPTGARPGRKVPRRRRSRSRKRLCHTGNAEGAAVCDGSGPPADKTAEKKEEAARTGGFFAQNVRVLGLLPPVRAAFLRGTL